MLNRTTRHRPWIEPAICHSESSQNGTTAKLPGFVVASAKQPITINRSPGTFVAGQGCHSAQTSERARCRLQGHGEKAAWQPVCRNVFVRPESQPTSPLLCFEAFWHEPYTLHCDRRYRMPASVTIPAKATRVRSHEGMDAGYLHTVAFQSPRKNSLLREIISG